LSPRSARRGHAPSRAAPALAFALAAAAPAGAGERRIPFWPDAVPQALQRHVDGLAALETVRALARHHRVHGSPGFAAAAELMRRKAADAGLTEAAVESLPADGVTRYAHFRSYYGWIAEHALLEEVTPRPRVMARFPELPVALADYSQDADVTAEVVDVGAGASARDYEGKAVAGRLVIASGALPRVHRLAVEERGAAGLLSDYPNQTTAWSGDDRDLVRWGHLSPYQRQNRFAFMLSKRQATELRARLAEGERIVLRARVAARLVPASYEVVSAVLPGTDPAAGEVLLTAHLCHQSAGANDNASGSAAILEVARALAAAVRSEELPRPRRGIRFLWVPEIAGSQAWLVRHPELARRLSAGIHMDMVGGVLATTRGTFHLSRTAESLPHVVNDVAQAFFDDVVRASSRHAERGGSPADGLVWLPGSRESFLGDVRGLELGSDHQVFQEASHGVPMVYFHDWPDVTIHTNKDQPENLDATKLGRVAYLGAGIAWTLAALPEAEAKHLLALARAGAEERLARARLRRALAGDAWDGWLAEREAAATGDATLRSIAALWPSVGSASGDVTGAAGTDVALTRRAGGDVLAYEALNLVDGRRSVSEIRDVLTGRYAPVPLAELAEYLELLARARVLGWR
jgi:hypothetical protein